MIISTRQQGREFDILMERDSVGRTPHFTEVAVAGKARFTAGEIVAARITGQAEGQLIGEVVA